MEKTTNNFLKFIALINCNEEVEFINNIYNYLLEFYYTLYNLVMNDYVGYFIWVWDDYGVYFLLAFFVLIMGLLLTVIIISIFEDNNSYMGKDEKGKDKAKTPPHNYGGHITDG